MGEREQAMRDHGVYSCPWWCSQSDGSTGEDAEQLWEEHVSHWIDVNGQDGDSLQIRARMSWWANPDGTIDCRIEVSPFKAWEPGLGVLLGPDGAAELAAASLRATELFATDRFEWAYDGAERDRYDREHGIIDGQFLSQAA